MKSCLWLERPGAWRYLGVVTILLLAAVPEGPLLWQALSSSGPPVFTTSFAHALRGSMEVAALVAGIALVLGLPAGVCATLYEFPGRRIVLPIAILPLLVPTVLWAIGWSALSPRLGPAVGAAFSGLTGCVVVFLAAAIPLVLLVSYAATATLSGSLIDAARLAGGERTVAWYACRHAAIPACLAAGLSGVVTLSDPGPGQILGQRTAASEILTSFSSLYDFGLAGRQCVMLAGLVLLLATPLAIVAAPRLSTQVLARQTLPIRRSAFPKLGVALSVGYAALILVTVLAPVLGLVLPLSHGADLLRAWREVARTGGNTLLYAAGAGMMAATLGFLLALCVGRNSRLRTVVIGIAWGLFALPPSLAALGIVQTAAGTPAWLDLLFRSRATVCWDLGFRFLPVAVVLGLRAWGSLSVNWTHVAAIHGVPLGTYLRKVILPQLWPALAATILLIGLLAAADVGTVLLLHPPGKGSLPLAIFTIMANAPDSLVASLCLWYLTLAAGLLTLLWSLGRRGRL